MEAFVIVINPGSKKNKKNDFSGADCNRDSRVELDMINIEKLTSRDSKHRGLNSDQFGYLFAEEMRKEVGKKNKTKGHQPFFC